MNVVSSHGVYIFHFSSKWTIQFVGIFFEPRRSSFKLIFDKVDHPVRSMNFKVLDVLKVRGHAELGKGGCW